LYSDGTYLQNNPDWHAGGSAWKAGQIATMLHRNGVRPADVCEIGCGAGEVLIELANRLPNGVRFSGYEISSDAYAICAAKSTSTIEFQHADMLTLDRHFDVALAIDVFEHVEDYLDFLRRLRQKARYKIFHIPLELSWLMLARSNSLLDMRRSVGHLHHFSKETALATLEDAGYTVYEYVYTAAFNSGLYELTWKQRMLRNPRRAFARIAPDSAARIMGGYSLLVLAE